MKPPSSLSAGTVDQNVANAQQQGQQLQNQYNQQAAQTYGQYQDTYNQAQAAQKALQGYNVQGGGDLYNQYLNAAQQRYGFDPSGLAAANKALFRTQIALANAPEASRQMGNYYGTTAGQAAQGLQNLESNLGSTLSGQNAAVSNYQNLIQASQALAGAQTTAETTTQGQRLTQLTGAATNAADIMKNAAQTMNDIETLQQQQGGATAAQVAAYQKAYSDYVSAQGQYLSGQGSLMQGQAALNQQQYQQQLVNNYLGAVQSYFGFDPNKGKSGGLKGDQLKNYNDLVSKITATTNK